MKAAILVGSLMALRVADVPGRTHCLNACIGNILLKWSRTSLPADAGLADEFLSIGFIGGLARYGVNAVLERLTVHRKCQSLLRFWPVVPVLQRWRLHTTIFGKPSA